MRHRAARSRPRLVSKLLNADSVELRVVIGLEEVDSSDSEAIPWAAVPSSDRSPALDLDDTAPAYMLFTSGSTGQPKGILHSHASALAYARLAADMYDVSSEDVLGNFAPLHFDQSTFEFYSGPMCGATTVLIPPAYGIALANLASLIEEERLTFWYSVPSVLLRLLQSGTLSGKDLSAVRWVLFGGEVFPHRQLQQLVALLPHARFSNVYGPTEVNQCTCYNFSSDEPIPEPLPIGAVWADTDALVVDENDEPVTTGAVGELLIHSATMMLGYWERPELNRSAFHEHRGASGEMLRYYRTGDLVRSDDQGNLAFLGRKDRQVKSRGHRVELDEIEAVLAMLDDVEEAATFTVSDDDGVLLIDAAVTLRAGSELNERGVAQHAARHLPPYARPRRVYALEEFPRTRTGKIDRNALAELVN